MCMKHFEKPGQSAPQECSGGFAHDDSAAALQTYKGLTVNKYRLPHPRPRIPFNAVRDLLKHYAGLTSHNY